MATTTQPLLLGRKLPSGDWEGDGLAAWHTCTDHSLGRMVAFATNGRIVKDGAVYRAAIPGHPEGATLEDAKLACHRVTGLDLVIPMDWDWPQVRAHLRARKGLILQGWYAGIPRQYRFQASAEFAHAIWVSHESSTSGMRVWDALDANTAHYGSWVPPSAIRAFLERMKRPNGHLYVGYVPLQPL